MRRSVSLSRPFVRTSMRLPVRLGETFRRVGLRAKDGVAMTISEEESTADRRSSVNSTPSGNRKPGR